MFGVSSATSPNLAAHTQSRIARPLTFHVQEMADGAGDEARPSRIADQVARRDRGGAALPVADTGLFRNTLSAYTLNGTVIPADAKGLLLFASGASRAASTTPTI